MLARTRETEELGFDGLFLVDHFYGLTDVNDPTHEAYTMLAALAPFTQRMRLGIMVCGNTYRNPAFLLKQAVTVDHISNGRVDFGVGAGWTEREHEAYGFPFPSARERVDRFAEALEIWDLLQRQERTTYDGTYYQLLDAPFAPKPLQQPRLPLLIGGSGPRMARLAARYADIWNAVGTPEETLPLNQRIDAACAAEGRDPQTLVRSVSPRINLLASPEAFVDGVEAYRAAGFRDIYMPWPRTDAERPVLRYVAEHIIPSLRDGATPRSQAADASRLRALGPGDDALAAGVLAGIQDDLARLLLATFIAHPDERMDGRTLMAHLGVERHDEVTRAVATLAAELARQGLARPWNEAQQGYMLPGERAALFAGAREPGA